LSATESTKRDGDLSRENHRIGAKAIRRCWDHHYRFGSGGLRTPGNPLHSHWWNWCSRLASRDSRTFLIATFGRQWKKSITLRLRRGLGRLR